MPAATLDGTVEWSMWTTTVRVVTADPAAVHEASRLVADVLVDVDQAASRFRVDSELSRLNACDEGASHAVSDVLWSLLVAAVQAAEATEGLVDPTIACSLNDLGYDRTITSLSVDSGRPLPLQVRRPIGWQHVVLDERRHVVEVPRGCQLDLGATAKAWAADRAAAVAAERTETGVLVSLGGDIAVAGPPPACGWVVAIADDHACPGPGDPTVVMRAGGLATSSTTTRRWRRAHERLHHIIDPRTARPARECWRTVTVAAASCLDANVAATASIIRGASAAGWLSEQGLPARLVAISGSVSRVAQWPAEAA